MTLISLEVKSNEFAVVISMENAAFEDDDAELARILHVLAGDLEVGRDPNLLMDINGNRVGTVIRTD